MEMDHTKCHEPCDMTVDDESDCKWLLVVICGLFPFFQAEAGINLERSWIDGFPAGNFFVFFYVLKKMSLRTELVKIVAGGM